MPTERVNLDMTITSEISHTVIHIRILIGDVNLHIRLVSKHDQPSSSRLCSKPLFPPSPLSGETPGCDKREMGPNHNMEKDVPNLCNQEYPKKATP